jgi:uncharacterized repeat protein (TIGR03803 family)
MKMKTKNLFLLPALIAGLNLTPTDRAMAQTITVLHSFTALIPSYTNINGTIRHNNSDGGHPDADLIVSGSTLYGTAPDGGSSNAGTIFKIGTDGTGFTILHRFPARSEQPGSNFSNSDGAKPNGALVLSGNALYGTAAKGGSSGYGTVFRINTDGTALTVLRTFEGVNPDTLANSGGASPYGGLTLSGNALYGTTSIGGIWGQGTIFKLNTDGTGFATLHDFTATDPNTGSNSDGATPDAGLVLSGDTLFGVTKYGGSSGNGTLFKVNTDGTGFTTLRRFTGGSDGGRPYAELTVSGDVLYGTAAFGGVSGNGTVFKLNTNGTGFTVLHSFTAVNPNPRANSDGANPAGRLFLSGNTLYGTTFFGGGSDHGAVFAVNTDGTGFTNLHSFSLGTGGDDPVNSDGAGPFTGVTLSGNTLYGTAQVGGSSRSGTVFSLSLPSPPLTITTSGGNIILTWPTNPSDFFLISTVQLGSASGWTRIPLPQPPIVINGQYVVTVPNNSNGQQWYGLSR